MLLPNGLSRAEDAARMGAGSRRYCENGKKVRNIEKPFELCLCLPLWRKIFYPKPQDPEPDLDSAARIGCTLLHFITLLGTILVGLPRL